MRELWATKDYGEREDEEAERLVRPLPKYKPPRKDRRREEMETDRDPDVDGDPDLKGDPDLSMNYKNVGGSAQRVAYRFLIRKALDSDKVLVKNKETGKETEINKETLKEQGSKYEVVKHEDKGPAKEEGSEETQEPKKEEGKPDAPGGNQKDEELKRGGAKLHEMAKDNPGLAGFIKNIQDPASGFSAAVERFPDRSLKEQFPKAEFPEELKTLGDLHQAMKLVPKALPKGKQPKEKAAPAPEEGAAPKEQTQKAISDAEKSLPPDLAKQLHPMFEQLGKTLVEAIQKGMSGNKPSEEKKPEAPAKEEPKKEEPKKEEPKAAPKEPEAPKEPKPAKKEKWPGRRTPSPKEIQETQKLIAKEMPPKAAMKLMDMHPDDAREIVSQYKGMQALGPFKDEKEAYSKLEKLGDHFTLDPSKVPPPKTWKNDRGKEVPFDQLRPEEQEIAKQKHQAQVVAYNIATRERAIQTLYSKGLPLSVAAKTVDLSLRRPPTPSSPEEAAKQKEQHAQEIKDAATEQFIASVGGYKYSGPSKDEDDEEEDDDGGFDPALALKKKQREKEKQQAADFREAGLPTTMSDQERKKALSAVNAMPQDAKALAVAHLAADDYHHAMQKYLSEDSHPDHMISEHESPNKIISKINRAIDELDARAVDYPKEVRDSLPNAARVFREQALARLKKVDPEKFEEVNKHFQRKKFETYEAAVSKFKKDAERFDREQADFVKKWDKWEARRKKAEERHDKEEDQSHPYRKPANFKFDEKPPEPPKKPVEPDMPEGYLDWKVEKPESARDTRKTVNDIERRLQTPDLPEDDEEESVRKMKSPVKRIVDKFRRKKQGSRTPYSSYASPKLTMGTLPANGFGSRQAVYHGVAPYEGHNTVAPYVEWTQAHQRDLSDADNNVILAAAREWMKSTVLSSAIEGMVPDARYRAALDLAIRDVEGGKYSGAVTANLYNTLLAKLAGESTTGTLETIREASSPRKLAFELRKAAAEAAELNPVLAYDLLGLADQVETPSSAPKMEPVKQAAVEEDTYEALRASIIRTASSSPNAKQALLPVLRLIRTQDEVRALRRASFRNE